MESHQRDSNRIRVMKLGELFLTLSEQGLDIYTERFFLAGPRTCSHLLEICDVETDPEK